MTAMKTALMRKKSGAGVRRRKRKKRPKKRAEAEAAVEKAGKK